MADDTIPRPPHLWEYLSREELILVFCVTMVAQSDVTADAYPINEYPTPGEEGPTNDWTELTKRAIRYLSFEHGSLWQGIQVHRDGSITGERPIAEIHAIYIAQFKTGGFPNFDILIPQALDIASVRVPTLYLEPMRSLLAEIQEELRLRIEATPVEVFDAVNQLRDAAREHTHRALGFSTSDRRNYREEN